MGGNALLATMTALRIYALTACWCGSASILSALPTPRRFEHAQTIKRGRAG
jgi:hypothetical protein